ncbi:MAG: replication-relaxation family protein [Dehalococcoidia bacterium]|nr:replication-relaxation family protein [Dehalococcoidia bacterium]
MKSIAITQHNSALSITPADDYILKVLLRFRYLAARQVCALRYSAGSLTRVQAILKRLTDSGYLQRIWLPRRTPRGSAPSVYTLARKGLNYLRAQGIDVPARYHPSEQRERTYLFLAHTLAVNDVLIAAELFCRREPRYALAASVPEHLLKRSPARVEDEAGRPITVIPDGWIDLRVDGAYQICLVLELDRGTEEQKAWRRKVRGLLAYANGPYQEAFQTRSLTIAVVTTDGPRRLLDLLRWTERELTAVREQERGDLFIFTEIVPEAIFPHVLFTSPIWYRPFASDEIALVDLQ